MNRYSIAISPHKHLPSEILAKIFVYSLEDELTVLPLYSTSLPWVLRWVCSRWRQIALAEHHLWNRLNMKRSQSFSTRSMVKRWIPRIWNPKQTFPLSLKIRSSSTYDDLPLRDVLSPYFRRLQNLSIRICEKPATDFLISPPIPFDSLESLVLDFTKEMPFPREGDTVAENPPVAVFSNSPRLRKVTVIIPLVEFLNPTIIHRLPWSQLTHLTIGMGQMLLWEFCYYLRQCSSLVRLSFTSWLCTVEHSASIAAIQQILLPTLQSMTLGTEMISTVPSIFRVLRVPLMKEFVMNPAVGHCNDHSAAWDQPMFIDMLSRSGCSLSSLELSSFSDDILFESLFAELPGLVKLVVSQKNPIPGVIFDMMGRREIFSKLEYLECLTTSPISFLKLLEHQYETMTSGEYRGLFFADVSYTAYRRWSHEQGEFNEIYNRLKPRLENGEKNIYFISVANSRTRKQSYVP